MKWSDSSQQESAQVDVERRLVSALKLQRKRVGGLSRFRKRHYDKNQNMRITSGLDTLTFIVLCFILANSCITLHSLSENTRGSAAVEVDDGDDDDEVVRENTCEDCQEDADENLYFEDKSMVCSDILEYSQVQPVGHSESEVEDDSEVEDEDSDDAESLSSPSHGSCLGNLDDLNESQLEALFDPARKCYLNPDGGVIAFGMNDLAVCQEPTDSLDAIVEQSGEDASSGVCSEEIKPNVDDPTLDTDDDSFEDTNMKEDVSDGQFFGVRGPKSTSVLEPNDCYQLSARSHRA